MANNLGNSVVTVTKDAVAIEKFALNLPNIRSLKGFIAGMWDLSIFTKAFPGRNRLSDVDGSIELNGHTLVVEFKTSKWGMNQGQVLKAIRQAKYSNICTMFVFGKTNTPTGYLLFTPKNLQPDYVESDTEGIVKVMQQWVAYTEENSLVESRTDEWKLVGKYFGRN